MIELYHCIGRGGRRREFRGRGELGPAWECSAPCALFKFLANIKLLWKVCLVGAVARRGEDLRT